MNNRARKRSLFHIAVHLASAVATTAAAAGCFLFVDFVRDDSGGGGLGGGGGLPSAVSASITGGGQGGSGGAPSGGCGPEPGGAEQVGVTALPSGSVVSHVALHDLGNGHVTLVAALVMSAAEPEVFGCTVPGGLLQGSNALFLSFDTADDFCVDARVELEPDGPWEGFRSEERIGNSGLVVTRNVAQGQPRIEFLDLDLDVARSLVFSAHPSHTGLAFHHARPDGVTRLLAAGEVVRQDMGQLSISVDDGGSATPCTPMGEPGYFTGSSESLLVEISRNGGCRAWVRADAVSDVVNDRFLYLMDGGKFVVEATSEGTSDSYRIFPIAPMAGPGNPHDHIAHGMTIGAFEAGAFLVLRTAGGGGLFLPSIDANEATHDLTGFDPVAASDPPGPALLVGKTVPAGAHEIRCVEGGETVWALPQADELLDVLKTDAGVYFVTYREGRPGALTLWRTAG